jgi:hypothetical protein
MNKQSPGEFVATHQEDTVPRFYFDVWAGDRVTHDPDGLELEGVEAAEHEAVLAAAAIGKESLPHGEATEIVVQVKDEHDYPVLMVMLAMSVRRMELAHG